jgi:hypothetical protein
VIANTSHVCGDACSLKNTSFLFFGLLPDDCVTDGNMEDFRQANRTVANVAACRESELAADAESKRSKAATVVNAMALLWMTPARIR